MTDNIYLNPDWNMKYGDSVHHQGECYIKTDRTGEMTHFNDSKLVPFKLIDHSCNCAPGGFNACNMTDNMSMFGVDHGLTGKFKTDFNTYSITSDDVCSISANTNTLGPTQNKFTTPTSYLYMTWIKPKSDISSGSSEINILNHSLKSGLNRFGVIISISSDDTNNDGSLSVLMGNGDTIRGWSVYKTSHSNWLSDTWYHVSVLQTDTKLDIYLNNNRLLSTSTISMKPAIDTDMFLNHGDISPIPIHINSVVLYNHLPISGVTRLIDDHHKSITI